MLNDKTLTGDAKDSDVHEVGKMYIYQSHALLCYTHTHTHTHIYIYILTFMALLLCDRNTEYRLRRKIAGMARRVMYTKTKTDDHLSGDGSKYIN
jgi:hypothetical protein